MGESKRDAFGGKPLDRISLQKFVCASGPQSLVSSGYHHSAGAGFCSGSAFCLFIMSRDPTDNTTGSERDAKICDVSGPLSREETHNRNKCDEITVDTPFSISLNHCLVFFFISFLFLHADIDFLRTSPPSV